MFIPPRRPDGLATFDLRTGGGGEFRGLTGDELSWIQKVTQCTNILQASPFIVLYDARIKNYRRSEDSLLLIEAIRLRRNAALLEIPGWPIR